MGRSVCEGWGASSIGLYGTLCLVSLMALSPFSVVMGISYNEGISILGAVERIIDEYVLYENLAWPALCFLHLPVHVVCLHLHFS